MLSMSPPPPPPPQPEEAVRVVIVGGDVPIRDLVVFLLKFLAALVIVIALTSPVWITILAMIDHERRFGCVIPAQPAPATHSFVVQVADAEPPATAPARLATVGSPGLVS